MCVCILLFQGVFLEFQLHQLASVVNDLTDMSDVNRTDQDRARLNLTLYRAVVAGQIPEGLKEVDVRMLPLLTTQFPPLAALVPS